MYSLLCQKGWFTLQPCLRRWFVREIFGYYNIPESCYLWCFWQNLLVLFKCLSFWQVIYEVVRLNVHSRLVEWQSTALFHQLQLERYQSIISHSSIPACCLVSEPVELYFNNTWFSKNTGQSGHTTWPHQRCIWFVNVHYLLAANRLHYSIPSAQVAWQIPV